MRTEEINIRDPFVLTWNGAYYLYGTRGATCWGEADGFDVYIGKDLQNWEGPIVCFEKPEGFWADRNYWAPEVHEVNGAFYMFASFKAEGVCRGTAVLRAERPEGPFSLHSDGPLTPRDWECLDGTLYRSKTGKMFLVFCHEWVQVGDGEVWAVELTSDLRKTAGDPFLLFHASDAPWVTWMTHSSGTRGCVTDGPFLYRTSTGDLCCLWASFSKNGYTEGVAVSDNGEIDGRFQQIEPLFDRDGGHGMVFQDLDGHLFLTLHTPNTHLLEHPSFIPLMEKNGRLAAKTDAGREWTEKLEARLEDMKIDLAAVCSPWTGPSNVLTPEDMGYSGSGKATEAIQAAMDRLSEEGGGTLELRQGDYLSGTVIFRSNVRLNVCRGARLMGYTDLMDYPEQHAKRLTVQDTSMGMHQSLIFAENCENIAIVGEGEICGQGTQANFPGEETAQGTPGRPFLLRVIDCRKVHISGITLRDAACWMQNYLNCERVLIEDVRVFNQTNYNNDGMDLDGCRDVLVRSCQICSGDDGICMKGAGQTRMQRVLIEDCDVYSSCNALKIGTDTQGDFQDILVENCRIGGVENDPSGLKHPWADSGISLEMMDGGEVDGIVIRKITMQRVWSPFFMRLENRGRVKPGEEKPEAGRLHHVLFSEITAEECGPRGSYFLGSPERAIEDVCMRDVSVKQRASVKTPVMDADFPRMLEVYPDAHMIDEIGDAPAFGLWVRHVRGLVLDGYRVSPEENEMRPEYVLGEGAEMTVM
ncbi:MAG: family 43 glycosylhydrolase [Clostridia bacterium]|nr:family 43 glycosylhydrolase [Clostridia bacterium]